MQGFFSFGKITDQTSILVDEFLNGEREYIQILSSFQDLNDHFKNLIPNEDLKVISEIILEILNFTK